MKVRHLFLITVIIICLSGDGISQLSFQLKAISISGKLFNDEKTDQLSITNDVNASLLFTPGLAAALEVYPFKNRLSLRLGQSILKHASLTGGSSFTVHSSVYRKWKSAINAGAGVHSRYAMNNLEEMKFSPIFIIEGNYYLARRFDASIALQNTIPNRFFLHVGLRYWIIKDKKKNYRCNTCPDF